MEDEHVDLNLDLEDDLINMTPINEWVSLAVGDELDCALVQLDPCRKIKVMVVVEQGKITEIRIKPDEGTEP